MDSEDNVMESAEAAMKAGSPALAGAILAAEALGLDPDPGSQHVVNAAHQSATLMQRPVRIGTNADAAARKGRGGRRRGGKRERQ